MSVTPPEENGAMVDGRVECERRCGFDTAVGHQPCATCRDMDALANKG